MPAMPKAGARDAKQAKELIQAKPLLIRKVLITISSQSPFTPPDVHRSQLVSHHSHHFGKDPP